MSPSAPFQRARRPEQKEERRLHLLDTAKAVLRGGLDVNDLSLNELARRAEMTKSNVYRYFENREALLLALLEEETLLWLGELQPRLAAGKKHADPVEHIAQVFASTAAARPLMCRLLSILPSIIEHNVSPERLLEFKTGVVTMLGGLAHEFHRRAPSIPLDGYAAFLRHALALLVGLWPFSHPNGALDEVLAHPHLAPIRYDFERDLGSALLLLLRGLDREAHA